MPSIYDISLYSGIAFMTYLLYLLVSKTRKWQISKLKYTREFSVSGVFEGENVVLIETIYNPTFLPMFFVDVEAFIHSKLAVSTVSAPEQSEEMQYLVSRFHLLPFMKIRRSHEVRCKARGYYLINTVSIFSFKKEFIIDAPAEIFVYPKLSDFSSLPRPQNNLQGDAISTRRLLTDPFSIAGIRDYQSGDPFNIINFKATAKTGFGHIKVNQRDFSSSRIFMIYINFQTDINAFMSSEKYERLMEKALSNAATIIQNALESGYHVGFSVNCYMVNGDYYLRFPITAGSYTFEEMLKAMAKIRSRVGVGFLSLTDFDIAEGLRDAEILLFTTYVDEIIDTQIMKLEQNGNAVSVILLEDEPEANADE